jgi:hypothetical protein
MLRHAGRLCQRLSLRASLNSKDLAGPNPVPTQNCELSGKLGIFLDDRRTGGMITILSALISMLWFRFRSRASLELELVGLRHQLIVLQRRRPRRLWLQSADGLLWVCLYRMWPRVLDALALAQPATVVKWHRRGFRIYWRWRSRSPGRPKTSAEIQALIRRMSRASRL